MLLMCGNDKCGCHKELLESIIISYHEGWPVYLMLKEIKKGKHWGSFPYYFENWTGSYHGCHWVISISLEPFSAINRHTMSHTSLSTWVHRESPRLFERSSVCCSKIAVHRLHQNEADICPTCRKDQWRWTCWDQMFWWMFRNAQSFQMIYCCVW